MKPFVQNINQYLLERFPIIWNTRLVWVLIVAAILHLLFFLLGYFVLSNPEDLHEYGAKHIFLDNGSVYVSIIISIVSLAIWLMHLFKNNAFKSFYPTSSFQLFKQFVCYLIIVFCLCAFSISYHFGLKTYITSTYPDAIIKQEIEQVNNAALFFSHDVENYTINNRRYPKPFNKLYCETYEVPVIDSTERYIRHYSEERYKFYNLKQETVKRGSSTMASVNTNDDKEYLFDITTDSITTYYYRDSIYDISNLIKSTAPSYYNYSENFLVTKDSNDLYDWNRNEYTDPKFRYFFNEDYQKQNKKTHQLLQRNNPDEIKNLLANALAVADSYRIAHNLTTEAWFDLIYHPNDFKLKYLILKGKHRNGTTNYTYIYPDEKNTFEKFNRENLTDFYIETDALKNVYTNIEAIKTDHSITESIHFYIWSVFLLATLIFMFRVTGLKSFIFAVLSTGILILFITLLTFLFIPLLNNIDEEYFVLFISLGLGGVILSIPILFIYRVKKFIVGICLNISIPGFIVFVFLLIWLISEIQFDFCISQYARDEGYLTCVSILERLGIYWSYILFIVNLIFIYFYMRVVKAWKSLPE